MVHRAGPLKLASGPGGAKTITTPRDGGGNICVTGDPILVDLHVKRHHLFVGDDVELSASFTNTSVDSIFLRLPAHARDTDGGAVLVAAGLRCEAATLSGNHWRPARVMEPREVPGKAVVMRERCLYLPPRQSGSVTLIGRVVGAAGLGYALRFGGGLGDAAEVLLPLTALPSPGDGEVSPRRTGVTRCRLHLEFSGDGPCSWQQRSVVPPPLAWVGPYEPRHPPSEVVFWCGAAVSEPVTISVQSSHPSSLGGVKARCVQERALSARGDGGGAPCFAQFARKTRNNDRLWRPDGRCPTKGRKLDECAGGIGDAAPDSAAAESECNVESGAAPTKASRTSGRSGFSAAGTAVTKLPRTLKATTLYGPEHGACWRGVSRHQDPLADPRLLELAENLMAMIGTRAAGARGPTIALCSERVKTRTGRRFVATLQSLGARVLASLDTRKLVEWGERPRAAMGVVEDLLLVADWQLVADCVRIVQRCGAEQPWLTPLSLVGVAALCDLREERDARLVISSVNPSCPVQVLPSLAFVEAPPATQIAQHTSGPCWGLKSARGWGGDRGVASW